MSPNKLSRLVALAVALACSMGASLLEAQRLGPAPKRPKIGSLADTNDARMYHDYGMEVFDKEPDAAAAAFYWAARIDPTMASALYGRRAALILSNKGLLGNYMLGTRKRKDSKEIRAVDSLYLRALMLDPFLYTRLDKQLFTAYVRGKVQESSRLGGNGDVGSVELDFFINQWLRQSDVETRAWIAYNDGQFKKALDYYRDALKSARYKAELHTERGRVFSLVGQADSAIVELNLALDELRKRDAKELVVLYNSKAVLEHSIGELQLRSNNLPAAREAYGRALQEDLSYYPAHLRLGRLALMANDTANAVSELDLATQIAPDEPDVHFAEALVLASFGKTADAIVHVRKAAQLEPYYAAPNALLGELLEQSADQAGALVAYDRFLLLAARADAERARIKARREALAKSGTSSNR